MGENPTPYVTRVFLKDFFPAFQKEKKVPTYYLPHILHHELWDAIIKIQLTNEKQKSILRKKFFSSNEMTLQVENENLKKLELTEITKDFQFSLWTLLRNIFTSTSLKFREKIER